MDDVRLTPAERQALDAIECALCREERDLDRALRTMRPKGGLRRAPSVPHSGRVRGALIALPVLLTFIGLVAGAAMSGATYLILPALVLVVIAATSGVVWCAVAVYLHRQGGSPQA